MTSDIAQQALQEHRPLIDAIDELVSAFTRLPTDIEWGSSQWVQDTEILDFIRIQTLSLQNAKNSALGGYYRDAYHLIRMVFEGYFILRLVSMCDKYPYRIRITKTKSDPTPDDAKNRMIGKAQKHFGSRLITTYVEDNGKILVCVLHGRPVVDDKGNDTGVVIPFYYSAWHNFRPLEYHLKRKTRQDKLMTLRFLSGEWASAPRLQKQHKEDYSALYRYFLTFERILDNLRLNGILNKKTTTRVLVHYNFLSNFSHSTSDSLSIMRERKFYQISPEGLDVVYNHYLSELALLYVCHLLSMHLEHAMYYLRWRRIKLNNEIKLYRSLCRKAEKDFGYFWFIFNKPHEYDRYSHANRKCNYKKGLIYRPGDIRLGDVRYYDDPLRRLKQLHDSQRELLTGNVFRSPFQRDDARF